MLYVLLQSNFPKDADGMANSVDHDQTVPQEQSDLGFPVCPDLSALKLRIITVTRSIAKLPNYWLLVGSG